MANKRDTSKQKRARQNRAEREARQARTKAAAEAPEVRRSKAVAAPAAGEAATPKRSGGLFGPAQPRPPRPGDLPVDIDALEGNWFAQRMQVPGGRQVLFGALLTGLLTITMSLVHQYLPEGADPKSKNFTDTIFDRYGARAAIALAIPLVIAILAVVLTTSRRRRMVWQGAAYTLAVLVLLVPGIYANYLLVVAFYGYGIWRAVKVEGPRANSIGGRAAARRAAAANARDDAANDAG